MTKKLTLLFTLMLSTLMASAYDAQVDGIYYNLITKAKQAEVTSGDTKYTGSVTIPESFTYNGVTYSVTSIGGQAFYNCSGLTSVTIPNSVTSIGGSAFSYCSGLTSITIPNSVTSIGSYVFIGCSGLTSVTIPNSVTSIGYKAFEGCSKLTSVTIPNSVTSIGKSAFEGCKSLTSVTIGNSVTSIGGSAFYGCYKLTSVHITDIAAWCKLSFSDNLTNPLCYAKHLFMDGKEIIDLVIPNSVTSIGVMAFYGCSGLTSVTIPNSVTSIGSDAFSGCTGLTSVTIGNSVTSIGGYAFAYCSGLTSVTIGNSVTSIENSAFNSCKSLTSVTIPNSVTSIGESAFYGCSGLTSVTIGSGVEYINISAFASCSELADVYCYAENVPSTQSDAFKDSYVDYATLYVPEGSVAAYKAKEPWSGFGTIKTLSGEIPVTPKCATPTIRYVDGKLTFDCETEGVEYVSSITPPSAFNSGSKTVSMPTTYKVTVYATKDGYENSDVATKEINLVGGGAQDVNGDGIVDTQDVLEIYKYMQEH